ncbi:glutamine synthetase family protein [Mycolicibacterium bacteremicum]|uniref:glutamine synthetase family protein n=1 Tax=Mycolicibacterium bacteremicum TaxID=564198 RepID=UPI0026EF87F6|nr:glutamine synthetase family protein [Mycolicibacterium bacteremicum]
MTDTTGPFGFTEDDLRAADIAGVTIVWADNNGIPRARTVPLDQWPSATAKGVGITPLFAVFDTHDAITFDHEGLPDASGDIRLVPVGDRVVPLAGQPGLAWAPGRQVGADGSPWPYDQRGLLQRQVEAAATAGLEFRAGYEIEFFLDRAGDGPDAVPGHDGPAYSARALITVDEFIVALLRDLRANRVPVGQLHAEYGTAQLELSIAPHDPVTAADLQLLARQTIHAAAARHGFRASFSPLVLPGDAGNGWHLHTSVWRGGSNLLNGDGPHGLSDAGASYLAGLLRDLPAIVAVTAPSEVSFQRLRPGYFSSAYGYWGVQNREAALRLVPGTEFTGRTGANVELKPSDASANPYLALAAVIAAGIAGIADRLSLTDPIAANVGTWSDEQRRDAGVRALPGSTSEALAALRENPRVAAALGPDLLGAFTAVRRADAAWAADRDAVDIITAHRWRY